MARYKWVCEECGSDAVFSVADVRWNNCKQKWELDRLHDTCYCHDCDEEVLLIQQFKET